MLSRSELKLANSEELRKKIKRTIKVDRSYDIPYIADYSKDGKTVFIDRHFKSKLNGIDVSPFVIIHEVTEKTVLDNYGLRYHRAHLIAEHIEKEKVKEAGLEWNKYQTFVMSQYKGMHHEKLVRVPHNLDLTPYRDSHDYEVMKELMKVGHISKGSHEE